MRYVCALLVLSCLLLVLPAQASQADSGRSSDVYCGPEIGGNMQSLSIWDVIFDNERLLLKGQGFLWNHLLALGLAQLASTLWLAVQIEHLRQRVEAHEQELQPDSNASGTRSFRSECSVLRNPQAAFFGLDA